MALRNRELHARNDDAKTSVLDESLSETLSIAKIIHFAFPRGTQAK